VKKGVICCNVQCCCALSFIKAYFDKFLDFKNSGELTEDWMPRRCAFIQQFMDFRPKQPRITVVEASKSMA